jgi:hypothetical protein
MQSLERDGIDEAVAARLGRSYKQYRRDGRLGRKPGEIGGFRWAMFNYSERHIQRRGCFGKCIAVGTLCRPEENNQSHPYEYIECFIRYRNSRQLMANRNNACEEDAIAASILLSNCFTVERRSTHSGSHKWSVPF